MSKPSRLIPTVSNAVRKSPYAAAAFLSQGNTSTRAKNSRMRAARPAGRPHFASPYSNSASVTDDTTTLFIDSAFRRARIKGTLPLIMTLAMLVSSIWSDGKVIRPNSQTDNGAQQVVCGHAQSWPESLCWRADQRTLAMNPACVTKQHRQSSSHGAKKLPYPQIDIPLDAVRLGFDLL